MKGESICLVDADLRTSSQPIDIRHPNVIQQPSLNTWLTGAYSTPTAQDLELPSEHLKITPARLPCDRPPLPEDVLLIGGRAMSNARTHLEAQQEWTFYNLPPVGEQEAGFEALQQIGAAVLVVRSGQTRKADLSALLGRLQRHNITVAAAVLCDIPDALMSDGKVFQTSDLIDDVKKLTSVLQPARF
jgi:hypothetical protein